MDLKAICDHLSAARMAIGPEHPLSTRIKRVERGLTPDDSLWRNDAVIAQTELLAISTELEEWPTEGIVSGAEKLTEDARAEYTSGVNEAIKQIADAIELL
jgi:hypothetical protein